MHVIVRQEGHCGTFLIRIYFRGRRIGGTVSHRRDWVIRYVVCCSFLKHTVSSNTQIEYLTTAKTPMTFILQRLHLEHTEFFQWLSGRLPLFFSWLRWFTRAFVQNIADPSQSTQPGMGWWGVLLIKTNCIVWKWPCQTRRVAIVFRRRTLFKCHKSGRADHSPTRG